MQKLKEANLYRSELIPVKGKLVERYNKCLLKLGFTKTKLTSFSIDGIGWSPEVAEEKKDRFYLNNGEANSHAILITPLQKGLPVFNPFHSYDKELMKKVFHIHGSKIKDITRDSAICIDFDQKIDVFYEPLDILKYKDISIKFHLIDNLTEVKQEQSKLVEKFLEDNNFIDESIHEQLLVSANKYGDLRDRNLNLYSINYTTDSFYTEAFGGVFLLRDFVSDILIFESGETYQLAINDTHNDVLMYHISHPELIYKLQDYSIIGCDLNSEVDSKKYNRIKKYVFSQCLNETQHPIQDVLQNEVLFKSYLNKIDIKSRKRVMSVERYLEKVEINNKVKISDTVDSEIYYALHSPYSSLKPTNQDLIWKLLVKISPKDILFLYWYDKMEFYKTYEKFDESMKEWVIKIIIESI